MKVNLRSNNFFMHRFAFELFIFLSSTGTVGLYIAQVLFNFCYVRHINILCTFCVIEIA